MIRAKKAISLQGILLILIRLKRIVLEIQEVKVKYLNLEKNQKI